MLVREDGPVDVFAKLRTFSGMKYDEHSNSYGTNIISSILSCLWCTSVWVAFLIAILDKPTGVFDYLQRAMALSASAIMIDEILIKNVK